MTRPLSVLACGAITPVGLSAPATFAAVRAGISAYAESGHFQSTLPPEPLLACRVPPAGEDSDAPRHRRLAEMAANAIAECLEGVDPRDSNEIALLLCVEERYRGHGRPASESVNGIVETVQDRLAVRFHPLSRAIEEGNAGPIAALALARELIATGQVRQCVVGGVDSLINVRDLRLFESAYRLKQRGVAQGFVPGEAAAFLRVAFAEDGSAAIAHILGIGVAREEDDLIVLSEGHPTGRGLGLAARQALQAGDLSEGDVVFRISDLNGEHYRGIESTLAFSQTYRSRREEIPNWLHAMSFGEVGAAAGAVVTMMASLGMAYGRAPGSIGICESSSDQGLRACCVVASVRQNLLA